MLRGLAALAFALVLVAPLALSAQPSSSTTSSKTTTTSGKTASTTKAKTKTNGTMHHGRHSPWSNVLITGVNAQDYLASPTPKPVAKKNKVNKTGGTVFKKIGN